MYILNHNEASYVIRKFRKHRMVDANHPFMTEHGLYDIISYAERRFYLNQDFRRLNDYYTYRFIECTKKVNNEWPNRKLKQVMHTMNFTI